MQKNFVILLPLSVWGEEGGRGRNRIARDAKYWNFYSIQKFLFHLVLEKSFEKHDFSMAGRKWSWAVLLE